MKAEHGREILRKLNIKNAAV